ncbi:hypothetical protein [Legionella hackeliae]|uniref:Uncharacterized protein n=1 Tax=Legionella hackeliae TaxID=449 RepID=A0A0A8UUF4_LEGHA|nr:hypothetical protein [Legionella hackeliae]KTD11460.1 hypothetical protein Lhac_1856 [Legionella hackeliae]CEK10707.1 conserved exported protein of unknown function [Legionella hackeliae]STX47456.1 Uncharacterised protein [Legionella hackeliae]
MKRALLFIFFSFLSIIGNTASQVLVLSGGDNPGLNHYSQYLQTKTLYEFLVNQYGKEIVSVYFGAGNNELHQPIPLDVHKKINTKQDKYDKTDLMLTGIISNNHPATKGQISSYFFSPKILSLKPTDNLFLFVSDHGMPYNFFEDKNAAPYSNNCIDLWHYDKPFINNFTNESHFNKACLSKNELRSLLEQVPSKHIVFVMSQCYSGGFHQLSVKLKDNYPSANPKICGFTAATEDHYASGCTADADGATYQGYERSFTENYTGTSILSGHRLKSPSKDIFTAHQQAILDDMTVDVPISTSDYYLLQWADYFMRDQFSSRIANFNQQAIQKLFNDYKNELKSINNQDLNQFVNLSKANEAKIISLFPQFKEFTQLSIAQQTKKITALEQEIQEQGDELESTWEGMMNLYRNVINAQWSQSLRQHQITHLNSKIYQFEQEFYQAIIKQDLYKHPFQLEMYYLQYLSANNNDKELADYQKNRLHIIRQWAKDKDDPTLANTIDYYQALDKKQQQLQDIIAKNENNKQLLKRILTYNKIIAAWVTLIKINDKTALDELQGLLRCEHSELIRRPG